MAIEWSIGGQFILLDEMRRELVELDAFGEIRLSSGLGNSSQLFQEITWFGVSPSGLQVVDRLSNEITHLDFNLNPVDGFSINPKIFPELGAIDSWGRTFLYSRTYNQIFLLENNQLIQHPFVDFTREFGKTVCLQDLAINEKGEIGLLDCNGTVILLSEVGQLMWTLTPEIPQPEYLVAIRGQWFVFNRDGDGHSLNSQDIITIPGASVPVIDIATMNRSLAILAKDHILILNVQ